MPRRLRLAFLLALSHPPSSAEEADMRAYFQTQLTLLRERPAAAREIVPAELTASRPTVEVAAWTALASVLLNTDEFITRE